MGRLIVYSSPVEDREQEYNDWYDHVHLREVLALEPFTAARRFKIPDGQVMPQPGRYVAIYEFEGSAAEAIAALMAAAPTFHMTDAMDPSANLVSAVEER